jgi:5-methyltetrahydrofolate--homocysteine methyltransferase
MGPTAKSITVVGRVTFPELVEVYYQRAAGLLDGGVDILVAETCNDTRAVKAALVAIERLRAERGTPIPTMVSGTIETIGTMLAGQTADAFCAGPLT